MKAKSIVQSMKKLNIGLLIAFALPVVIMLAIFVAEGIYPFGNRSFVVADMYHQYVPFYRAFLEMIKAGEGLSYSFHAGIGTNFLALYVYYLASPLHWLGFLFGEANGIEFLSYLAVCKIGLCGLSMAYYLQKRFENRSVLVALFSSFYALSGFMMAYNYNIMWLDCVILLPLIVLGLEQLVKKGKWSLYCITLGLSIFTNYYISIMICLFLVMYFIYLWMVEEKGFKAIYQFALCSILAAGMAAILLVPEVMAILGTDFGNSTFPKEIEFYFSLLDEMARHCMCVGTERGLAHWPNIYCGVAIFVLVPMYVFNERISVRRRFGMCVMLGIFLFGFSINALDFLWHGYNYPDSLPARQAFIYIFLVLSMCFEGFVHMREEAPRKIVYGFAIGMAFLLFCQRFVDAEHFEGGSILISMIFVLLYGVVLYCYHRFEEEEWRRALFPLAIVLVIAELLVNSASTFLGTTNRDTYLAKIPEYRELYNGVASGEEVSELGNEFYRVELFEHMTKNDGVLIGAPTASLFSSTQNSKVADWYERLGMRHSKVYYRFDGATPFTSALLNVNYMFGNKEEALIDVGDLEENILYSLADSTENINLYACEYVLPFGYVAPSGYEMVEGYKQSPLRLQNAMVRDLGIEEELFIRVDGETVDEEINLTVEEDGYYYMVVSASGTKKVMVTLPKGEKEFKDLKKGCVLSLGYLEGGSSIAFVNSDETDETEKIKLDAYRMDEQVLARALEILSKQHLENVSYTSKSLKGSLNLEESGRLILSIPYEKGWRVTLNGEEVEPSLFGDVFMAFDLAAGEYQLEMHYVPYGRNLGIVISLVSIGIFGACMWLLKLTDTSYPVKLKSSSKLKI